MPCKKPTNKSEQVQSDYEHMSQIDRQTGKITLLKGIKAEMKFTRIQHLVHKMKFLII